MARVCGFLPLFAVFAFGIPKNYCQYARGMCERTSLFLLSNTKHNRSLDVYVFDTLNFSIWKECFNMCLKKCQCLSFNFNEINKTENCEVNDANTKLAPEALKLKEGVTYYEPVRTYYDKNVSNVFQEHRFYNMLKAFSFGSPRVTWTWKCKQGHFDNKWLDSGDLKTTDFWFSFTPNCKIVVI